MNSGTGEYERLLDRCASLAPVSTAVPHRCKQPALALSRLAKGSHDAESYRAWRQDRKTVRSLGMDLGRTKIVATSQSHASASKAVDLIRVSRMAILSK